MVPRFNLNLKDDPANLENNEAKMEVPDWNFCSEPAWTAPGRTLNVSYDLSRFTRPPTNPLAKLPWKVPTRLPQ